MLIILINRVVEMWKGHQSETRTVADNKLDAIKGSLISYKVNAHLF